MEFPIEQTETKKSRAPNEVAIPERGINRIQISNPPSMKDLVWYRSAKYPTEGWMINASKRLSPAIIPTCVKDRCSFSIKAG